MRRRLKQSAVVFVVLAAGAQLIRPSRANQAVDPARTISAYVDTSSGLAPILDRSCGDCHSNATVWPWYTQIAPLSWAMARGVSEGRRAVNFSEWAGYSKAQRQTLLSVSCDDVSSGKMPGVWTLIHPETKLSTEEVGTICSAARQNGK